MTVGSKFVRVLCVDDEPGLADLTATFLERHGKHLSTVTAMNAHDGIELLTRGDTDIDCIVSDFDMPNVDGLAFLQVVRADQPDLPFILFTGRGSEEIASDAISAGVTDYMQKGTGSDQYELLANRIQNVVDQHQARAQAAEAHERARIILDASPDAIIVVSNGEVVHANPQAIDLFNAISEDDITTHPFTEFVSPDDYSTVSAKFDPVQRGDITVSRMGHSVETLDGNTVPVEVTARHITWDGQPGVVGIIRDVSERVQREQELEESTQLLSTLFEMLPVGVVILDPEGQITRANKRAEEVLGLIEAQITKRTYDDPEWQHYDEHGDPIPDDDLPFAHVMATGEPVFGYEHGIRWPDGGERWLTMSLAPISSEADDIEQVVAVIEDITDQYEDEQTIKRKNDQLEEFASVASHDLRNPLNVAQGWLEMAREERESEQLMAVAEAHDRMEALITDLLVLARSGRPVGELESVALSDLVAECWRNVATAEATLVIETDQVIWADSSRFKQFLENLMRNAIEHGGIDVTVTLGTLDDGFYFEDNGPGIPEKNRTAVFETGYSTTEDGTGFGLSIVKQIMDSHDWEIRVTDGSDGGARFEITDIEFVAE